jgi:hypothetical protein
VASRSALLMYVLTLATGGLFAFVWLVLIMRDADRAVGRTEDSAVPTIILIGGLIAHLALFFLIISVPIAAAMRHYFILLDVAVAVLLFASLVIYVAIANKRISLALDRATTGIGTFAIIALTFAMMTSLIALQRKLNFLAARRV